MPFWPSSPPHQPYSQAKPFVPENLSLAIQAPHQTYYQTPRLPCLNLELKGDTWAEIFSSYKAPPPHLSFHLGAGIPLGSSIFTNCIPYRHAVTGFISKGNIAEAGRIRHR